MAALVAHSLFDTRGTMKREPPLRPPEDPARAGIGNSLLARPVLCAVDASEEGPRAARGAARLAQRIGAPLVLIHVARSGGWHPVDALAHGDRHAADRSEGMRLLEARAADAGTVASIELREGEPVGELLRATVELEPLLLVVGNRSHGVLDAILGCVARDVARWSPLPTLVLPDAAGDDAFERSLPLLCGVDDSAPSERAADFAAGLARVLDVELVLLSVVDARTTALPTAPAAMPVVVEPPELLERQQAAVREHAEHLAARLGARAMVEIGEPASRIDHAGQELDAGLLVVGTRRRTALAAALTGSVSAALMSGPRPLLIVP
jgi:nucleotide-binding universal stress UspA family protein